MNVIFAKKCAIISCIIALILCSCMEKPEPDRYYDKERGFSIEFPYKWDIEEYDEYEVRDKSIERAVIAINPLEEATDQNNETVVFLIESIAVGTTLEEYYDEVIEEAFAEGFETEIEEQGDCIIDGVPAKWLIIKTDVRGNVYRLIWYCLVKDNKAYMITGNSVDLSFYNYRGIFDATAKSLRFE